MDAIADAHDAAQSSLVPGMPPIGDRQSKLAALVAPPNSISQARYRFVGKGRLMRITGAWRLSAPSTFR
jgi:hypothetical protein